jgi:hypothetical protein
VALARVYNVDINQGTASVAGVSIGTGGLIGSECVLMYGQCAAGVEANISAIRIALNSGASTSSYPTNGSMTFRLRPVSGTGTGILVGTATAKPIGQSTTAAGSAWIFSTLNGSGTGTFPTMANNSAVWSQTLPFTAGANWGEWFTPGFEINIPPSSTMALTFETSGGTGSQIWVVPELVISE